MAEGRYPFPVPSYETVRRAIHTLDSYAVMVAREGVEAARKAYDVRTIQTAIQAIDARRSAAMTVAGLLVDDWSPERIKQEEDRLFIGFRVTPDKQAEPRAADGIGRSIPDREACDLPPAAPADRPSPQEPVPARSARPADAAAETPAAPPAANPWTIAE